MDLTPEALRSARFREKLRGYHPDDVDAFLDSVADGLGVLLGRLREASERVRRVETGAAASDAEDSVRRTLVLAQRTADLAVAEAREEAAKLVADAEARAASILGNVADQAVATAEQAQEQLRIDLERLQAARDQLSADVRTLEQWLAGERKRLKRALGELVDRVESVRTSEAAPALHALEVPLPPTRGEIVTPPPRAPAPDAPAPATPATPDSVMDLTPMETAAMQTPGVREPSPSPVSTPSARTFAPGPPPERQIVRSAPRPPTVEPSPDPVPAPPPAPWIAPTDGASPLPTANDPDAEVFRRAQTTTVETDASPGTEDPYFAELRRAISDPQPLGPREDDEVAALPNGSVEDIFDARRPSRLRRRR